MTTTARWFTALAVGLLAGGWSMALAAEPAPTTITVPGSDCPTCAKKVVGQLADVPGVDKAEPDLKAKTVKVTPKSNAVLSPRALWEAAEKAGHPPTRLEGPHGVFTTKPSV